MAEADEDAPHAYLWRCEHGHNCAVSEVLMHAAQVEPRCMVWADERGSLCGGRLLYKIDSIPPRGICPGCGAEYGTRRAMDCPEIHAAIPPLIPIEEGHTSITLTFDVPNDVLASYGTEFEGRQGITVESIAAALCREHRPSLGYIRWRKNGMPR